MSARLAIYWAPPLDGALWRDASLWLGRDAATGEVHSSPGAADPGAHAYHALTAKARAYGFHATLKAPFVVREGFSQEHVRVAAARFASTRRAFTTPPLRLASVDSFLALILSEPCADLDSLAADCVRFFDPFRAPASVEDLARRRSTMLSARQDELLVQWGYPYVLDQFRFHMTLTDSLDADRMAALRALLESRFAAHIRVGQSIESICLFKQDSADAPFLVDSVYRFGR